MSWIRSYSSSQTIKNYLRQHEYVPPENFFAVNWALAQRQVDSHATASILRFLDDSVHHREISTSNAVIHETTVNGHRHSAQGQPSWTKLYHNGCVIRVWHDRDRISRVDEPAVVATNPDGRYVNLWYQQGVPTRLEHSKFGTVNIRGGMPDGHGVDKLRIELYVGRMREQPDVTKWSDYPSIFEVDWMGFKDGY